METKDIKHFFDGDYSPYLYELFDKDSCYYITDTDGFGLMSNFDKIRIVVEYNVY